jgi:hypothetical protein
MAQGRAISNEAIEKLLKGLRNGMTRRAAAGFAGFSKTTLYRMLDNDPDGTLVTAIEKAEAEAEATYTFLVATAATDPKNWTAAAWWLERRHPAEYGKRERVEMTGKDGGPIDHRDVSALSDYEKSALAEAIRDHLASQRGSGVRAGGAADGEPGDGLPSV